MTLHVNSIEALWFVINTFALGFTLKALYDAQVYVTTAHEADISPADGLYDARLLTAHGNRRREVLRAVVQLLFLSIVIPLLFVDGEVALSPFVIALMASAITLLVGTVLDARDRVALAKIVAKAVTRTTDGLAKESSVQENIAISKEIRDRTDAT